MRAVILGTAMMAVAAVTGVLGQQGRFRAEVDLVEAGEDDAGHVALAESDREGLLRPDEACRDAEVDVHPREPLAQPHRLLDAELRETFAGRA